MKITKYLSKLAEKRTRNVLTIIVMFACASICLGEHTITINSALTPTIDDNGEKVFPFVAGNSNKPDGTVSYANIFPLDPNNNTLIIKEGAKVGQASGAGIDDGSNFESMTGNKVIVNGGDFTDSDIAGPVLLS
ncbi:hypothetical protein AGMMS49531_11310 [Endomicrobiia bacterium]|nr:hypothetical protein AGMMS49531_11310 [Endomicrobiia bacterium]